MKTAEEVGEAVAKLPAEELSAFRRWFAEFEGEAWDRDFKEDVRKGRLDALADEAILEHRLGLTEEL